MNPGSIGAHETRLLPARGLRRHRDGRSSAQPTAGNQACKPLECGQPQDYSVLEQPSWWRARHEECSWFLPPRASDPPSCSFDRSSRTSGSVADPATVFRTIPRRPLNEFRTQMSERHTNGAGWEDTWNTFILFREIFDDSISVYWMIRLKKMS